MEVVYLSVGTSTSTDPGCAACRWLERTFHCEDNKTTTATTTTTTDSSNTPDTGTILKYTTVSFCLTDILHAQGFRGGG